MKLIIGNQNYSSWSLRPWLLLTAFGMEFEQQVVSLHDDGMRERLLAISTAAKVPVLLDDGLKIWDTMAICEYISEVYLDGKGWPQDVKQRAIARAITAEMHAGFAHLRGQMPMNIGGRRKLNPTPETQAEIAHIDAIWSEYAQNGEYLFGEYGIVDCFFTPVAARFRTYNIKLSPAARGYCNQLLKHTAMQKWEKMAIAETEILSSDKAGFASDGLELEEYFGM